MKRVSSLIITLLAGMFSLSSCQSTARKVMYSAYETVGVEKRDLLKNRVQSARDAQEESSKDFKDALTRLKELYGFKGGDLEKYYDQVKDDYEGALQSSEQVKESIGRMDHVAKDLFQEWEKEIKEIQTAEYRDASRKQLQETRERYQGMHAALLRSEKAMQPALTKMKDQVLYLKHNLNARAIDSLKGKGESLQADIDQVLKRISASIEEADSFIRVMDGKK